jgi:hypothetical protein
VSSCERQTDRRRRVTSEPPTLSEVVKDLARKRCLIKRRSGTDTRVVHLLLSRRGKALALQVEHRVRHVETTLTEFAYLLWLYAHQCAHTTADAILGGEYRRHRQGLQC